MYSLTELGDYIRAVNAILFFLLVGQSAAVLHYYWAVYRRGKRAGRKHIGLLPLHVLVVTVLFLGLAAEALVTNLQRLTGPPIFWTWANLVMFAAGNYALWLVLHYERRRFHRCTKALSQADAAPGPSTAA